MDNKKLLNRLEMIEASATVLLEEAAKLRKEMEPKNSESNAAFEIKKAKVLARYRKNMMSKN